MSLSSSPPTNTLVECPDGEGSEVYDVLDRPSETNLLVVSYRHGPDEWFRRWRTEVGSLPSEVGFVDVGETTRSTAAQSQSGADSPSPAEPLPFVDAVADPADLSRLGVRISQYLESWTGNGRQTVVCVDSLTALLDHVETQRAFRFLHILAGRVESVDGAGYYLLDPTAHDDESLALLREFADSTVEFDEFATV